MQSCNYSRVTTSLSTLSGRPRPMFREKFRPIARSDVTTTTRSGRCARHTVRRSHGGASVEPDARLRRTPTRLTGRAAVGSRGDPCRHRGGPARRRDGLEVLMLRRDKDLSFAGGMWVFPGGRIDPPTIPRRAARPGGGRPRRRGARGDRGGRTGARPAALRRWSHWTPPPESPKRFSTAFFVAPLPDGRRRGGHRRRRDPRPPVAVTRRGPRPARRR